MRNSLLTVLMLGASLSVAGCSGKSDDDNDKKPPANTNPGGSTDTNTGTNTGTDSGTGTSTGTSGGGGNGSVTTCDLGTAADETNCGSCATGECALTVCANELQACGNNAECLSVADCIEACADEACVEQCGNAYAGGVEDYAMVTACLICVACPIDCDGANSCS